MDRLGSGTCSRSTPATNCVVRCKGDRGCEVIFEPSGDADSMASSMARWKKDVVVPLPIAVWPVPDGEFLAI